MRHDPYKLSSGLLTLCVHAFFFVMLYLGVSWQTQQPEGMQVELWGQLPQAPAMPAHVEAAPPPPEKVQPPKPREAVKPPPAPEKPAIQLPAKKPAAEIKKPKEAPKPEKKKPVTKAEQKRMAEDMRALEQQEQQVLEAREAKDALAAKAAAAISSEEQKYRGLISAKIRRNIVMPPDVADNIVAEFIITLLPDGSLLNDPKMLKSSGNATYDNAVLRAILKAQPFPLPENEAVRVRFVNPNQIRLKFSPTDGQ